MGGLSVTLKSRLEDCWICCLPDGVGYWNRGPHQTVLSSVASSSIHTYSMGAFPSKDLKSKSPRGRTPERFRETSFTSFSNVPNSVSWTSTSSNGILKCTKQCLLDFHFFKWNSQMYQTVSLGLPLLQMEFSNVPNSVFWTSTSLNGILKCTKQCLLDFHFFKWNSQMYQTVTVSFGLPLLQMEFSNVPNSVFWTSTSSNGILKCTKQCLLDFHFFKWNSQMYQTVSLGLPLLQMEFSNVPNSVSWTSTSSNGILKCTKQCLLDFHFFKWNSQMYQTVSLGLPLLQMEFSNVPNSVFWTSTSSNGILKCTKQCLLDFHFFKWNSQMYQTVSFGLPLLQMEFSNVPNSVSWTSTSSNGILKCTKQCLLDFHFFKWNSQMYQTVSLGLPLLQMEFSNVPNSDSVFWTSTSSNGILKCTKQCLLDFHFFKWNSQMYQTVSFGLPLLQMEFSNVPNSVFWTSTSSNGILKCTKQCLLDFHFFKWNSQMYQTVSFGLPTSSNGILKCTKQCLLDFHFFKWNSQMYQTVSFGLPLLQMEFSNVPNSVFWTSTSSNGILKCTKQCLLDFHFFKWNSQMYQTVSFGLPLLQMEFSNVPNSVFWTSTSSNGILKCTKQCLLDFHFFKWNSQMYQTVSFGLPLLQMEFSNVPNSVFWTSTSSNGILKCTKQCLLDFHFFKWNSQMYQTVSFGLPLLQMEFSNVPNSVFWTSTSSNGILKCTKQCLLDFHFFKWNSQMYQTVSFGLPLLQMEVSNVPNSVSWTLEAQPLLQMEPRNPLAEERHRSRLRRCRPALGRPSGSRQCWPNGTRRRMGWGWSMDGQW